jgi:hypothetical protein
MPALRFGAGTRSSKDNRFRPTEEMNGLDPDERLSRAARMAALEE